MFTPPIIKAGYSKIQNPVRLLSESRKPVRRMAGAARLAAMLMLATAGGLQAADYEWNTATGGIWNNGNWTLDGNWNPEAVPENDGSATLRFDLSAEGRTGNVSTGIDAAVWSISGLYYHGTSTTNNLGIFAGSLDGTNARANQSTTLIIGAGGITLEGGNASGNGSILSLGTMTVSNNRVNVVLAADQAWSINRHASNGEMNNHGTLRLTGDLSGSGNLLKTGNGYLRFEAGSSADYTGVVTLDNGGIIFTSPSQFNRLGTEALQWNNTGSTTLGFSINQPGLQTYAQNIVFTDTGSGLYNLNTTFSSNAAQELEISGTLSGALNETLLLQGAAGDHTTTYVSLTGDNAGLTSSKTGGNQNSGSSYASAVYIRQGNLLLDHANALGEGNYLSVSLGDGNSNRVDSKSSLVATDGNHVSSKIYTSINDRSAGSATGTALVGLAGAGRVAFTGDINLGATSAEAVNFYNLQLFAGEDGVLEVSGAISDSVNSALYKASVIARGGGTVILKSEENIYGGTATAAGYGGTSIIEGSTLVVDGGRAVAGGSGTGTGNVSVGYNSASTSATTTSGSGLITVSDTSGLRIGQAVSGEGIAEGSYIARIFANNTVQLNTTATANGTTTLVAAATTGTLAGSGRIRPGEGHAISVAEGGVIAPGDPTASEGSGSLATLVLDGGGTAAPLVSLSETSSFEFQLDGGGTAADRIDFWNYTSGDLVLSGQTLSLSLTGTPVSGTHEIDLFRFFSDEGESLTLSGITGGLQLVYDEGSIENAFLTYHEDRITLTYGTVIPEPETWAFLGVGFVFLSLHLQRRGRLARLGW